MAKPKKTPRTQSTAEKNLRAETPEIIKRVEAGASILAAAGMSGIPANTCREYLTIGTGGLETITDTGLRKACKQFAEAVQIATAKQEAALAARWHKIAHEENDWRAIAELLKRKNPNEWNPVEKQEVALDADVTTHRAETEIINALKQLETETKTTNTKKAPRK